MTRRLSTTLRVGALGALALALCAASPSRAAAQTATASPAPAADTAMKDLPLSPAELEAYAGTYSATSPEGRTMTLTIVKEKGTLVGTMNGTESSRLRSQGGAVVRPEQFPDVSVTFSVEGGRATKITMRQGERVLEMPRVP